MVSSTGYNVAINPNLSSGMTVSNTMRVNTQHKQQENIVAIQNAKIKFHKIKSSDKYKVYGNWSDDYTYEIDKEITNSPELSALRNRYKLITFKNPISKSIYLKDCYMIDYIEAPQRYKGEGTKVVQSLVERSLADKNCKGKVVVNAEIIDGKTSPAGFFYKLGFRFIEKEKNATMKNWIKENTLINAPKITGMMYLPEKNIQKALLYNQTLL